MREYPTVRAFLSPQSIDVTVESRGLEGSDAIAKAVLSLTDLMKDSISALPGIDQNLFKRIKKTSRDLQNIKSDLFSKEKISVPNTSSSSSVDIKASPDTEEMAPFAKAVCDFVIEIFDLRTGNNWLRGRAITLLAQQLLGGTVERYAIDRIQTSSDSG